MKLPRHLKTILWIAFSCALVAAALGLAVALQKSRIASLESRISELEAQTVPLRFRVAGRGPEGISATLKLYDGEGRELDALSGTWRGERLFIDFVVVPVAGKSLCFPYRVFTDAIPAAEGTSLLPSYDRGGFPAVFLKEGLSASARAGLSALFARVKAGDFPPQSFGDALHEVGGAAEFRAGLVYKAVARLEGGMEIMEDDR